jgi:hypothetical protein
MTSLIGGNRMTRRERRESARKNKTAFVPQYNGLVRTYEEVYGKGYERFNSKFVTIKETN